MPKIDVNISVADPARFGPVVEEARKLGMTITQRLDGIGVASGSIESGSLPQLHRIPGIAVEPNRAVSIPERPRRPGGR